LRRSLFASGLCFIFAAPSLADPAMTGAPVTMRAAPSGKARVVQQIPANAEIDLSSCNHGWCYSSWRNLFGYIPAEVVVRGQPTAVPGNELPPPVVDAQPSYIAPPAWRWGGPLCRRQRGLRLRLEQLVELKRSRRPFSDGPTNARQAPLYAVFRHSFQEMRA
jgi:hypothetical protein